MCAMITPEMFVLNDVDRSSSAVCEMVPADQQELVRETARSYPEKAIVVGDSRTGSAFSADGEKTTGVNA